MEIKELIQQVNKTFEKNPKSFLIKEERAKQRLTEVIEQPKIKVISDSNPPLPLPINSNLNKEPVTLPQKTHKSLYKYRKKRLYRNYNKKYPCSFDSEEFNNFYNLHLLKERIQDDAYLHVNNIPNDKNYGIYDVQLKNWTYYVNQSDLVEKTGILASTIHNCISRKHFWRDMYFFIKREGLIKKKYSKGSGLKKIVKQSLITKDVENTPQVELKTEKAKKVQELIFSPVVVVKKESTITFLVKIRKFLNKLRKL